MKKYIIKYQIHGDVENEIWSRFREPFRFILHDYTREQVRRLVRGGLRERLRRRISMGVRDLARDQVQEEIYR